MQFNGVSCNLYFKENVDIYFQTVTDEVFLAWCLCLDLDLKGTFHKSNEVEVKIGLLEMPCTLQQRRKKSN